MKCWVAFPEMTYATALSVFTLGGSDLRPVVPEQSRSSEPSDIGPAEIQLSQIGVLVVSALKIRDEVRQRDGIVFKHQCPRNADIYYPAVDAEVGKGRGEFGIGHDASGLLGG